jgi:hypothetical protein
MNRSTFVIVLPLLPIKLSFSVPPLFSLSSPSFLPLLLFFLQCRGQQIFWSGACPGAELFLFYDPYFCNPYATNGGSLVLAKLLRQLLKLFPLCLALHCRLETQTILFIKCSGLSRGLKKSFTIALEIHRSQFWRLPMIQGLLPPCSLVKRRRVTCTIA